jgi:hypothetical protein
MATKPPKPTKSKIRKAVKKSTEKAKKKAAVKLKKKAAAKLKPKPVATKGKKKKTVAKPLFPIKTCQFIEANELVPPEWTPWFWSAVSENAPFSWGDNNRSMITALDFAIHCEEALELHATSSSKVKSSEVTTFIKVLRSLGDMYIDLEN